MARILLVEPSYRNKYPPLGLMKISSYHKMKGDLVKFVKGKNLACKKELWDRIYISTLFTFYWDITVDTILYYKESVKAPEDVFVGGVLATLMERELQTATGVTVVAGLLNRPESLGYHDHLIVDQLIPDYSLISETQHKYSLEDAYIGYATRGCPNACSFCAVKTLEPEFQHYLPLKKQIRGIEDVYGTKQDLVLLDNNVLASDKFEKIIEEIMELGFERGAKLRAKMRRVDFNQGIDGRLLTKEKLRLLAKIAIKPLRIAFDHIEHKEQYIANIRMAAEVGIMNLSNYVLYNYLDTPEDFYERLRINCELNEELGTKIYSFPMKYIPLNSKTRNHIGPYWSKKMLRGIQCILLATRGLVSPRLEFFEAAFGKNADEFRKITLMPEDYIIHRENHKCNGASDWAKIYDKLSQDQKTELFETLKLRIGRSEIQNASSANLRKLLKHHLIENTAEKK